MSDRWYAAIAGGGTMGHVTPGLAVAHALVERGHAPEGLHFLGSQRGAEAEVLPGSGFPHTLLPGRGVQRRLSLDNVEAVSGVLRAGWQTERLLGRHQPAVVVAVGGYACAPAALAARRRGIPVVVLEQNVVPGATNRFVARLARAAAVSFPGTPLPRAVVTGNPIPEAVAAIDRDRDRDAARAALGLDPDRRVVLVVGGSLGSRALNDATVTLAQRWRDRADLAIHHVTGPRDHARVAAVVGAAPRRGAGARLAHHLVDYEHQMALAYAAADLAIARAGSATIHELAAARLPAILVPWSDAAGDHQRANARCYAETGAAVVVEDAALDADLAPVVERLLADADERARMAEAAGRFAKPDAAARIAALVEQHARHGVDR